MHGFAAGVGPLEEQPDVIRGSHKKLEPGDDHKLVVDLKSRCNAAYALGVILDVRVIPDNDTIVPLRDGRFVTLIRAHLQSGIGGTYFRARCDFLLGTTLVVPAENLKVEASYLVFDPCDPCADLGRVKACLPPVEVSVGLAYFGIGRNSNAARFTDWVCVPAGQKVMRQIPQYAVSWTARLAEPATSLTIRSFGWGTGIKTRYDVVAPLTNVGQHDVENAFPIGNGDRFLELDNSTGSAPVIASLIYGLAI
jgi:hypothetical protein